MARFVVVSVYGWCPNIAAKFKEEGHTAYLYIHEDAYKEVWDGLIEKIDDLERFLLRDFRRETVLVADNIGVGALLDAYRDLGFRVWGGSAIADKLEKDREFARKVFEKANVKTPRTVTVSSIEAAIEAVRASRFSRVVLKPHSNFLTTYVSEGVEDAIETLLWWKKIAQDKAFKIDVQEYIKGKCVDVEVWLANGFPVFPPNYTVETKKFMVDDLGVGVGCMSSIVWASPEYSRIVEEGVLKVCEVLFRYRLNGPLSINFVVDENFRNFYALEFTPRIGYNAHYCLWELFQEPISEVILRSFAVRSPEEAQMAIDTSRFSVGVEVSIPPSPFEHADKQLMRKVYDTAKGVPLTFVACDGVTIHPTDVKLEEGKLVCAGTNAIVAELVTVGEDVEACVRKLKEAVKKQLIPNKQARIRDIAEGFMDWYEKAVEARLIGGITHSATNGRRILVGDAALSSRIVR